MGDRRVLSIHQEHELLLKLEAAGLNESDAQRIIESSKNKLARELVALIRGTQAGPTFSVTVNYAQTVEAMVKAGRYNYSNDYITGKNFKHDKKRGVENVEIELVHFDRYISTNDAVSELDRMGLRPATLVELLAFGAAYPDKQREFPVVALGSVWRSPHGDRDVPCLWGYASERFLDLAWPGSDWLSHYRFAAVRNA